MKTGKIVALSLLAFSLGSCIKKEIPVPAHETGDAITNSIELGTDYRYQAYYDCETNSFVSTHLKTAWDLGFETDPTGFHLILNSSCAMAAAYHETSFESKTDTVGSTWKWDNCNGHIDSTAVGNWQATSGIYIINRGYTHTGTHRGFWKIKMNGVDASGYNLRVAQLDGSDDQLVSIPKNQDYVFQQFSFEDGVVNLQPHKEAWDLVFGQYTHLFEPTVSYLVTGVIANRNQVEVAEDFATAFTSINGTNLTSYSFSPFIDVIGYDWKEYVGSTYITHPEKNYIVKTTEGLYYKIHFIDFYTDQGEKGAPRFEIQAL